MHVAGEPLGSAVRAALADSDALDVTYVDSWPEALRRARGFDCLVVATTAPARHVRNLAALTEAHPETPVLLVTRRSPQAAAETSEIRLHGIVWASRVGSDLVSAVESARTANPRYELAASVRESEALSGLLEQTLLLLLRSPRPILQVESLARALSVDRRTLWKHWTAIFDDDPALRLKDLLDWTLLAHAVEARKRSLGWEAVARELGVSRQRLTRISRRLTGRGLSALDHAAPHALPEAVSPLRESL